MLGISGGDPSFTGDDGSAEPLTAAALAAFAAGRGSEHAALTALAGGRLLVPIVAVLADQPGSDRGARQPGYLPGSAEEASEMALPTLIGLDGRRAVPAFTGLDSLRRWRAGARPVPVAARSVWQAAMADSCAVVIDVAGPVPLAVEGARLAALARGEAVPLAHDDPDIRAAVADVLASEPVVSGFQLSAGGADRDLAIGLFAAAGRADRDVVQLADRVAGAVMARVGARLRRGVAIWFSSRVAPPPMC